MQSTQETLTLGERLKRRRAQLDLRQVDVQERCSIPAHVYSAIERGRQVALFTQLKGIAAALETTVEELISDQVGNLKSEIEQWRQVTGCAAPDDYKQIPTTAEIERKAAKDEVAMYQEMLRKFNRDEALSSCAFAEELETTGHLQRTVHRQNTTIADLNEQLARERRRALELMAEIDKLERAQEAAPSQGNVHEW